MRTTTAVRSKLMRRVTRWSMLAVAGLLLYHTLQADCAPSVSVNESSKCIESEVVLQRTGHRPKYEHPRSVQPSEPDPLPVVPEIVERVVAAESRGESMEGQMAVAQTIMNTANHYGLSYEQVALGGKYTDPVPYELVTDSVKEACYRVMYLGETVVDEPIMWFYSTKSGYISNWHENSLQFVVQIGNHKFFKERSE